MARREYKGAAVQTRLTANIGAGDTSFGINSAAGWPTGGANGEFHVTLDPGLSTEERIRVGSRSATTLSSITRGVDDTTAVAHSAGADGTVIHSFSADDADEANAHINDTTLDQHAQYMRADGTRHDVTARHSGGSVIPTAVPVAVGTALAEGAGTTLARSTHVHTIGTGAINAANMFAAGVVDAAAIGADQVGTSEIAPLAVTSAELAADSVTSAKIADTAIDSENYFGADLSPIIISATNPGAVGANRFWFNTTAAKLSLQRRNAGDTNWDIIQTFTGINYTPTLSGISLGNGLNYARYRHHGGTIIADGYVSIGSTTVVNGLIGVSLPITAKDLTASFSSEFFFHAAARMTDNSTGNAYGAVGVISVGTPSSGDSFIKAFFFATAGGAGWNVGIPVAWASGDRFSWFCEYEPSTLVDANYQ